MSLNSFSKAESEYSDRLLDELNYTPGTEEYRQARKRRQNRESAARVRAIKKHEFGETKQQLRNLSDFSSKMQMELFMLKLENEKLKADSVKTEKSSQIYSNIAILFIVVVLFSLELYSSSPSSTFFSSGWINPLLFPLLILALFLK